MILHNLDCKNNGEAQRFGSYLDKLEEMQEKLAAHREILTQQLSATTKQYLEIKNEIQSEDTDAVYQQCAALRPSITVEREQTLFREGRVDDTSILLAKQIVDTKIGHDYNETKEKIKARNHTDRVRYCERGNTD